MRVPGSMQGRLGLVFLLLTAATTSLFVIYWLQVLEPRLEDDARTQANVMAHSQAWLLADALSSSADQMEQTRRLGWAMDEILVLTDPNTHKAFIHGIVVELDRRSPGGSATTKIVRGNVPCNDCFVSDIPLYSKQSRELLGIATFHSSSRFFEQLRSDVRKRLYLTMAVLILLLSSAWWVIHSLLVRARRSDAILSQTFDAMSVPVLAASLDMTNIIRSNQSAVDSFSADRVAPGLSLEGLFDDKHEFEVLQKAVSLGQDVTGYECELRDSYGKPYWALLAATQVHFQAEPAVIISIADISRIKYAEQVIRASEERFATVVDSIDDLIYVADMESYELLFLNRAARKVFGNRKGSKCWEVLQQDQDGPCSFCSNARIVDEQGRPRGSYTWTFHNPVANRWYSCTDRAVRWSDGRIVRLESASDITELKLTQLALEQARDQAEAASRAKSEFLATMSHEIRTPLNGIIGMGKLLMRQAPREDQREYIDAINLSSEQLLLLINDILDISKIEAGKLQLEPHDFRLDKLVDDTVRLFELRASEKGLQLERRIAPDTPLRLHGDATRLQQVLLNLVSNAIKFTHEGSVRIEVAGSERPDGHASISLSVIDTGMGIPTERAQQIFEEFTQLETGAARRYEGTGLGLAICKRLIDAMGGEIHLSTSDSQGSTFNVELELPLAKEPDRNNDALPYNTETCRDRNILLVEDNLINSRVAQALLEQEGHRVTLATNGAEALDKVRAQPFDLILMDLHMPVMDGIDATRAIRQMPDRRRAATPVVALTANIMQEERERCIEAGMDNFIAKPFTPEKLQAVIQQTLATTSPVSEK